MKCKAQISLEFMLEIVLLLLLFGVVLLLSQYYNLQTNALQESFLDRQLCEGLSVMISSAYASEGRIMVLFEITKDVRVKDNGIIVGNTVCEFDGKVEQETALSAGSVILKKINESVVLENA